MGGLSSAIRLQKEGYQVEIFEQGSIPGGKMHQIKEEGFCFDVGPTLVMMPSIYQEIFSMCGKNPDDYLPMTKLDPMYEVYFKADTYRHYKLNSDLTELMKLVEQKGEINATGFLGYINEIYRRYQVALKHFITRPFRKATDFYNPYMLLQAMKLKTFDSADHMMASFIPDKDLQQIEDCIQKLEKENKMQNLDYPWWLSFEDTFLTYRMKAEPFCWQIQGQRCDLDFKEIQTIEELIEYSKLVAGSVGYMLLPILVNETNNWDINLVNACVNLGIGMQITNILRDVGEDLTKRKRVYLPQELLKNYQLGIEDLRRFCNNFTLNYETTSFKHFINLWEELTTVSKKYYESLEPYIMDFEKTCRLPLAAASKIYQSIEQAVRDERYDCFTKRCYTNKKLRNTILVQVLNTLNNKTRG